MVLMVSIKISSKIVETKVEKIHEKQPKVLRFSEGKKKADKESKRTI